MAALSVVDVILLFSVSYHWSAFATKLGEGWGVKITKLQSTELF